MSDLFKTLRLDALERAVLDLEKQVTKAATLFDAQKQKNDNVTKIIDKTIDTAERLLKRL